MAIGHRAYNYQHVHLLKHLNVYRYKLYEMKIAPNEATK